MKIKLFCAVVALFGLCACSRPAKYVIGVSQCSNDAWRQKVNKEIRIGQYQYDNVDVVIASADNDGRRQARQIDSLVARGVSLLVVAPSDISTVTPAVNRAYRQGIPVILFDRKTSSPCYTAYIGSDNVEIGRIMGRFIAARLHGHGHVVELMGIGGSSPVDERHRGFAEAMSREPGISVTSVHSDWRDAQSEQIIGQMLDRGEHIDCVFGQNDAEAYGGYKAARRRHQEKRMIFVGIDGLPGPGEGIDFVRRGCFAGSYIYPTSGVEIVSLAMKILQHKPYRRVNYLPSSIVTPANAEVVAMQNAEQERQSRNLDHIYQTIDHYVSAGRTQQVVIILATSAIALLIGLFIVGWWSIRAKAAANEKEKRLDEYRLAFFTNVSHELRTPLTLIEGPLNDVIGSGDVGGTSLALLNMARRNATELHRLVNDIMDLRKIENGRMTLSLARFDLGDTLRSLAGSFAPMLQGKGLSVVVNAAPEATLTLVADETKIERIASNLLSNAARYAPAGSTIAIGLSNPDPQHVSLTVTDHGTGMSQADCEKIFERYYQAPNAVGGTGIGLSLVKDFTELHHGTVSVQSQPGQGTTFTVTLPLAQEGFDGGTAVGTTVPYATPRDDRQPVAGPPVPHEEAAGATPERPRQQSDDEPPTVLVVEDNDDMQAYLRHLLEPRYTVLQAADGEEGLRQAGEHVPDVILTDVMMPVMDGLELCRRLKAGRATCHIPVVLLTARNQESQQVEGYGTGADDYVTKPFSSSVLLARVNSLLKNRERLKQAFSNRLEKESGTADGFTLPVEGLSPRDRDFITDLQAIIEENMGNAGLRMDDIGEKIGLGRVQLYRKVKALTGMAPVDLLREARLARGKHILQTSRKTISEVAFAVGFNTPSYFTTCFKQRYGVYPNDVRGTTSREA